MWHGINAAGACLVCYVYSRLCVPACPSSCRGRVYSRWCTLCSVCVCARISVGVGCVARGMCSRQSELNVWGVSLTLEGWSERLRVGSLSLGPTGSLLRAAAGRDSWTGMNVGPSGQADPFSSTLAPQQFLCSHARRQGAPDRDPAQALGPLFCLPSSYHREAPFHLFPPSRLTRTIPPMGAMHGVYLVLPTLL